MPFRTKLDFSSNRQIKQFPANITYLSGGTSFGVPFSALTTGPDLTTSAITQSYSLVSSSYSGNSGTTIFTWGVPEMSLGESQLSALTPSNSATTQNVLIFTANTTTVIDGNTVALDYTGVTYPLVVVTMDDLGGGNYSGTLLTNTVSVLSAGTLDYTGRTIWVDVSGYTRTQDLIVTKNPQVGYVLTCIDSEGKVAWQPSSGSTGTTNYYTTGATLIGTTAYFDRTDTLSAYTLNLSALTSTGGTSYWSASTGTNAIVVNNSDSLASGINSLAEGIQTTASGGWSHSEGESTQATGIASHAEGQFSIASGDYSHAEGGGSIASGALSHVEGYLTSANGQASHAEGSYTTAIGNYSHAEGRGTIASANYSHAEGRYSIASGIGSHAEGGSSSTSTTSGGTANGLRSHAEGQGSTASGTDSHAEGASTTASGTASHAEGYFTRASGDYGSHAEGSGTTATTFASHAEGQGTYAAGIAAHAEGGETNASGQYSHAEGSGTTASGRASHSQGQSTIASGDYSHAGGLQNTASGAVSFVHGSGSTAGGVGTIVLGNNITGTDDNTVYVHDLYITGLISTDPLATNGSGKVIAGVSDARLKENVETIGNTLSLINKLRPVSFKYKQELDLGNATHFGLIAQEVQSVFPELVKPRPGDPEHLNVSYIEVIPLLINAINELSTGKGSVYLETQSILAEDNDIQLNYSGNQQTSIGGGIRVLHAIGQDQEAEFITDENGNWITNNDIKAKALTIPLYTPTSSNDSAGSEGNITRDEDYIYIKTNSKWKRTKLEEF